MVKIRRVYDPQEPGENFTILVDRLWPRGISKEQANWNEWMKEIAPSSKLRKWFGHDISRWNEFKKLYADELRQKKSDLIKIKRFEATHKAITLLFAASDREHNNACVLFEMLTAM